MIIADSAIQLSSQRVSSSHYEQKEHFQLWHGTRPQQNAEETASDRVFAPGSAMAAAHQDRVSLSGQGMIKRRISDPALVKLDEKEKMVADFNMRLLRALFEKITGKEFRMVDPIPSSPQADTVVVQEGEQPSRETVEQAGGSDSQGFGLIYQYSESYYESEKTDFSANGVINTADGKEVDFSVDLSMSREFYSENNLELRAGNALKDPLVINFEGTAAQLSTDKFHFDIDSDGRENQISFVEPGSGFLALDKNGDGVINNGGELFGTESGNGFIDLAAYDGDDNQWIDEQDTVFDNLRIWSRDAAGKDSLVSLGSAGVGALYLGHIESTFALKDQNNELLGQIGNTGLAAMESGDMVTLQQVDLVA